MVEKISITEHGNKIRNFTFRVKRNTAFLRCQIYRVLLFVERIHESIENLKFFVNLKSVEGKWYNLQGLEYSGKQKSIGFQVHNVVVVVEKRVGRAAAHFHPNQAKLIAFRLHSQLETA